MEAIHLILRILALLACLIVVPGSILFFIPLRWPAAALFFIKLFTSAISPILTLVGGFILFAGIISDSLIISFLGLYVILVFLSHWVRLTSPAFLSHGFKEEQRSGSKRPYLLPRRFILRLPKVPEPRLKADIAFATIPGTNRQLLCDLWQPNENIRPSGLAFIYLHGSAWYLLDKDLGTRLFFRHLAAQGHVVMDVAYRLAPETDMMGMIHDAKRAINWMKENARTYGVNADQIVLGGGSAGGHLALMAAYTSKNPEFIPQEMERRDLSVRAVMSLYGPADLELMYYYTNQHLTTRSTPDRPKKAAPAKMPDWVIKKMGADYHRLGMDKGFENAGAFAPLLGGHPDECPETYAFFSPINHVHKHCPPTLLLHGAHDLMAPVKATKALYEKLLKKKVPALLFVFPQTDHAFDLILPGISPSAHTALYQIEHFLAVMK